MVLIGANPAFAETQNSSIQFNAPISGETLKAGETYEIEFTLGITAISATLSYSTDGGASWNYITNLQFTDSSYMWTVPNITTTQAMLKITLSTLESSGMGFVTKTYYNVSDAFSISQLIVIQPILLYPNAPTDLVAEGVSSSEVNLSWNDNAINESSYIVEWQLKGALFFSKIATLSANTREYTDTGLNPITTYNYRVYATNSFGKSDYSNISEATTFIKLIQLYPNMPINLALEDATINSIEISWTDTSSNETGFKIEREQGNGAFKEIGTVGENITIFEDTGLSSNMEYTYRIRAYNTFGNSDYSASLITETLSDEEDQSLETVMKFYINSTEYYVNDGIMTMDAPPVIKDSRTILPIRYVAEPLGADVSWDAIEKRVTISMGSDVIMLWINNNTANVNGINVLIDPDNLNVKPIILPPGRTMLPLRFIAENLGCQVGWNPIPKEVTVTK